MKGLRAFEFRGVVEISLQETRHHRGGEAFYLSEGWGIGRERAAEVSAKGFL